ncbi:MAG: PilX N-terminal domain-containing pilus assembly protein [Vicinamibacterales bacterium]
MTVASVSETAPSGDPRHHGDRGVALIVTLMLALLLTALGSALVFVTMTETTITANYRAANEVLYAADAASERVVHDLLRAPDWNAILAGSIQSGFTDGARHVTLSDQTPLDLDGLTQALQAETDQAGLWGRNDPVWRLYAYGPLSQLMPGHIQSAAYIVLWVADDASESDNNPLVDSNGVLTLRAQAFAPGGARRTLELSVARTSSSEVERGYVAQQGSGGLNQRARKGAVGTPGKALQSTTMTVGAGGMK